MQLPATRLFTRVFWSSLERPCSFWIAVAAFLGLSSFAGHAARAQAAEDLCASAGGTAECTGPQVGPYEYQIFGWGWSTGPGGLRRGSSRSAQGQLRCLGRMHDVDRRATRRHPLPPAGWTSFYVGSTLYVISVDIGAEKQQEKSPLNVSGLYGTSSTPVCGTSYLYEYNFRRARRVDCPVGYIGNIHTAGAYCWRLAGPWLKPKNLGRPPGDMCGQPDERGERQQICEERDYVGAGAFPLEFVRRYNSQFQPTGAHPNPTYVSAMPKWRGSYDKAVLFNESPTFPAVDVHREDGKVIRFELVGGVWTPDADVNLALTQHLDTGGATTGWTVITESDVREEYDAAGRLGSQSDRAGITHTVSYGQGGRIASVVHSFGYRIDFNYDPSDRLTSVSLPGGGTITYENDSSVRLTRVTYPDQIEGVSLRVLEPRLVGCSHRYHGRE